MARRSQIHFRLRERDPEGNCGIYLHFVYNRRRLYYSFGQRVNYKDWNEGKQRVSVKDSTIKSGRYELNKLLDRLEEECQRAYNIEIANGIPDPNVIKGYLEAIVNGVGKRDSGLMELLNRFIRNEIKFEGEDKTLSTLKTYNTLKGHLLEFEFVKKRKLDFQDINVDFCHQFITFLSRRNEFENEILGFWSKRMVKGFKYKTVLGLSKNSVAKDIQILKTVMREAVDQGLTNNIDFQKKSFSASRQKTEDVYLREDEIELLRSLDLSGNKNFEEVRDLFLLACNTGLRHSDLSTLSPENIITSNERLCIQVKVQKTKDILKIVCVPEVIRILTKYKFMSDIDMSKSHIRYSKVFNDCIRKVCKMAGLTVKGRKADKPDKELWDCVKTHTARRSFVTNMYMSKKLEPSEIMAITGHASEKSFRTYLKFSREEMSERIGDKLLGIKHKGPLRVAN